MRPHAVSDRLSAPIPPRDSASPGGFFVSPAEGAQADPKGCVVDPYKGRGSTLIGSEVRPYSGPRSTLIGSQKHPFRRGVMLDVSRNRVYSLETLKWVADLLAALGYDRLELYFENVFAYPGHEAVWRDIDPYTPEMLLELGDYCAARGIMLVPNQNTLGHFERWFRLPEYRRFAELPQGGARTPWGSIQKIPTGLCPTDPEAVAFAEGLLEALLPCFPHADTVNLGGDEVFDLGQGRSVGHDKAQLYVDHLSRMADIARRHGKHPEFWADMLLRHPEAIPFAAERLGDANWIVWGYEANDDLAAGVATLKAAGLRTLIAPGTSSWRSFCGRTTNMRENLRQAEAAAADGLLLVDWGDAGHWQPLAVSLPAIALAAGRTMDDLDRLVDVPGLGDFLLRLGDTYRIAKAEAGNSTLLFRAYNLPRAEAPAFDTTALQNTLAELEVLSEESAALGDSLLAHEARYALGLQRLAVRRALGEAGLADERARLAREMEVLWLKRGPRAQLAASLHDFLEPDL